MIDDVRSRRRPNLILGIVDDYVFHEIAGFLVTLRQTRFDGHLCLFAGPRMAARTVRRIRRCGAEVVRYGKRFPFVADPHPDNVRSLPEPIHIYNYRHFLYYDYLLKHEGEFANVLITDVKDVVFQRDPFDFPIRERIHVAMENPAIPIGRCPWTAPWVVAGYGEEVLERMRHCEMSCAGTTIAPAPLMKRYLRAMLDEIGRMRDAHACADQAAHNLLLHEGALGPVERHYNFRGPILTVGSESSYRLNSANELVNRDGSIIHIVHQYDRHRELTRIFEVKAQPSDVRRALAKAVFTVADRFRHMKRRAKSAAAKALSRSRAR